MEHTCSKCALAFVSTENLFYHVKTSHGHLQGFECVFENCNRRFQIFSSFKRHYTKEHCTKHEENTVENGSVPNVIDIVNLESSTDVCDKESLEIPVASYDLNVSECVDLSDAISNDNSSTSSEPNENIQDFPEEDFNFENYCQSMVDTHFQQLYANRSLHRKNIQRVTDQTGDLLSKVAFLLESLVIPTDETAESFEKIVNFLKKPFKNNSTEYLRKKNLQNLGFLIWPKRVFLDQRLDEKTTRSGLQIKPTAVTLTQIPLRKLFVALFECDGVYEMAESFLNSTEHLENGFIDDVCHSPFWYNLLEQFPDKFVIPFIFFYDEAEMNNALGSHAGVHKLGAGYVSLRCFPPEYLSRLCNIFLALLVHHVDKRDNTVFEALIDEFIFLEENGITIELKDGSNKQIYFVMVSIAGDNAGLDEVLGFVNSSGNYFCRVCKLHKNFLDGVYPKDVNLLRTKANYENDVVLNIPELTGIKENCVWNRIPSFHVIDNFGLELMHDNLEGVANYDMSVLIYYLIYVANFETKITLDLLNNRIQSFDYGYIEIGNKPPVITREMLVDNKKLKMKANEIMCLVRNFGLIIGDLVPQSSEVWQLYTTLCKINDITFARKYRIGTADYLNTLVVEHHELYLRICKLCPKYQKEILKPKYHNFDHLAEKMESKGPVRSFWAMRFEAKHNDVKTIASLSKSRIDVTLSIAIRQQFQLAYSLMTNSNFQPILLKGRVDAATLEVQNYQELRICTVYSWIKYNGRLYKKKCVLQIGFGNDFPVFAIVEDIYSSNDRIYFVAKRFETLSFDEHRHSYVVDFESANNDGNTLCINLKDLVDSTPLHARRLNNVYYITLPYNM